jgi:hypothetical protein
VHGLERVHAILRRLDDDFCDPLELRPDSALGVPGLLAAIRARTVLVANALGSGFLESPALQGFLPAICERLHGAPLTLPSLASWWCGERAAWEVVADHLAHKVVKPTYPARGARPGQEPIEAAIGAELSAAALAQLRAQIEADPAAYTVQDYLPLSHARVWQDGLLLPRAAMVRVFVIADGDGGWHAMPGGLTRIAGRAQRVVSMQQGGSSLDTWVQTDGHVDRYSMLPAPLAPADLAQQRRPVTSRAAERATAHPAQPSAPYSAAWAASSGWCRPTRPRRRRERRCSSARCWPACRMPPAPGAWRSTWPPCAAPAARSASGSAPSTGACSTSRWSALPGLRCAATAVRRCAAPRSRSTRCAASAWTWRPSPALRPTA